MSEPAIQLAVLHDNIAAQIREGAARLENVEVVFAGNSIQDFVSRLQETKPHLVIVDLKLLGPNPVENIEKLDRLSEAEKILVVYSFAKSSLIRQLISEKTTIMKAPINLGTLKTNVLNFLIRQIHARENETKTQPESNGHPELPQVGLPMRYSEAQLGRLAEITSSVECECPNHLAHIVSNLVEFELYSKDCLNKNDQDAHIHAMLYQETSKARGMLQQALETLVKYEKIEV